MPHVLYTVYTYTIDSLQSYHEKVKNISEPSFSIIYTFYKLQIISFTLLLKKTENTLDRFKYSLT